MLKNRLIPVLYLKDGFLVRSENFSIHQKLGNPVAQVTRYNDWNVDELIYIDITDNSEKQSNNNNLSNLFLKKYDNQNIIEYVSSKCFMPLTFGGGIRTIEDAQKCFFYGADKITINTQAINDPNFISELAKIFGTQAIVLSVDVMLNDGGNYEVYSNLGSTNTYKDPIQWCIEAEEKGAGEIFLNSIDRDGSAKGYDLNLISSVVSNVNIPVIACGGVGDYSHFEEGIVVGKASAVAAGNIFNFKELAYPYTKNFLAKKNLNFR